MRLREQKSLPGRPSYLAGHRFPQDDAKLNEAHCNQLERRLREKYGPLVLVEFHDDRLLAYDWLRIDALFEKGVVPRLLTREVRSLSQEGAAKENNMEIFYDSEPQRASGPHCSNSRRQTGHCLCLPSQGSMQAGWNLSVHVRILNSSPGLNGSRHTLHLEINKRMRQPRA